MPKLIILRGNSGCGKSSSSCLIREKAKKTALVEQDYLRRIVLKEREVPDGDNIDLIYDTVSFALERGYNVVLEGILASKRYKRMLKKLVSNWPEHYVYYFNVSLEETLRRHVTKPDAHEFGEKEMREWYLEKDTLNLKREKILSEKLTQDEVVAEILKDSGL